MKVGEEPDGSFVSFLVAMAVCLLFLLACFLPCIDCGSPLQIGEEQILDFDNGQHIGLGLLLFGWNGGNNGVPWSANVFLALGVACLWSRWFRAAFWLGILASLLGLTTWWVRRFDTPIIGYYVWQASLFILAGGAAFIHRKLTKETASPPLTETQKQDLLHRLDAYQADRHAGSTWEEIKSRLQER